ncbi:MAG: pantoate--beta-alanine ligase [Candidatus Omnitrophica bacterium]|nr:pantoate--beta-alanine ligase [Candidatus Omnitrophota bacterium]
MRIVRTIEHLRQLLREPRRKGQKIGFVPTMGYLHEGHLSLIRRAVKECSVCVVSIYVNPKQFGVREDLSRYPRDIKHDATMIEKENVDILFIPSDNVIYPNGYLTYIDVEKISDLLCGKYRPGHFRGVATIVAKLLNIVLPDVMYLGQKDAQQAVILKQMALDLNFSVCVHVLPTVREKDGLAASSRNVYLSKDQRAQAPVLYRALKSAANHIKAGERRASYLNGLISRMIRQYSDGNIQYVACVDAGTLKPLKTLKGQVLIALSVLFGKIRLIDNVIVSIKNQGKF